MTLLTPLGLLLLLPWAIACVWAGRGSGRPAGVPFLPLWPRDRVAGGPRRRRPPLWAVLLLAAALLAILAAAGPAVWRTATRVTVVVDRSPSMTPVRLKAALARLRLPPGARVRVFVSPPASPPSAGGPGDEVSAAALPDTLDRLTRTTRADAAALWRTVAEAGGPLIVLTDRPPEAPPGVDPPGVDPPGVDPPGVVRVAPPPLANAGIDHFAVVGGARPQALVRVARPQALVRVFNGTSRRRAVLRVDAVRQAVDLPPPGASRDYFVDLAAPADVVEAELLDATGGPWADDVAADDRAFVARAARPVRVEPHAPLSPPLARFAAVYARRRTSGDPVGVAVLRGDAFDDVAIDDKGAAARAAGAGTAPAVVLATPLRASVGSRVTVDAGHPVSRSLTPALLDGLARAAAAPPGDGWRTLAGDGDGALLAVRERPARQVWVGFDADALAVSAAFVVFWADVFDWTGGGEPAWTAGPVRPGLTRVRSNPAAAAAGDIEGAGGLYRDAQGRTVAVDMPAVRPGPPAPAGPPPGMTRMTRDVEPVAPGLLLTALGLIAAGLWAGRRLTDF